MVHWRPTSVIISVEVKLQLKENSAPTETPLLGSLMV